MKIKICGITNLADARFAAGAGADYLGYIQFPDSPRYILPERVAEIREWVFGAQSVGVFVNDGPDTINRAVSIAGFDLVQLHGDESVATCEAVGKPVIKAFRVRDGESADAVSHRMEPYLDCAAHFLVDTWSENQFGGTGRQMDLQVAATLARRFPIFLAGGLDPENVSQAVREVRPFGVDVSSGLEAAPGEKDFDRINAFMEAVSLASPSDTGTGS